MTNPSIFVKSQKFIYRNARPLDLARWKLHFENGSIDDVLSVLSFYQNDDGGFAYAVEPDNWNINSTPISAWVATMILREIGFEEPSHPIIQGILKYLDSGQDFSDGKWYNVVSGNNDYPHAIWWECGNGSGLPDDNPTVSLAGFILKFADYESRIYKKAEKIAAKAVDEFIKNPTNEFHTLRCFSDLLKYCEEIKNLPPFDINKFRQTIILQVNKIVCKEPEKWYTEYVCKPSIFFGNNSVFKYVNSELAEAEADIIIKQQLPDGSYPITWLWHNNYKEFEIAANWRKSDIIIKNMLYLKAFGKISFKQ